MIYIYRNFAYVYDSLMQDVDYGRWADFIEQIFKKYGKAPRLVADLGCGTGSLCIEMAKRGYEMIGVDISEDMLSCALDKSNKDNLGIMYLNQDMTEFELYGTVDVVLCLMDSVNYIIDKSRLQKMFKLVNNYLNPGGLFIFDINTPHKLKNVLGNNVFYDVGDDVSYIWQNNYDNKSNTCEFDLTFFIREGQLYERHDELHREKAYNMDDIKEILKKSNLCLLDVYDELKFEKPSEKSERIFYAAQKI